MHRYSLRQLVSLAFLCVSLFLLQAKPATAFDFEFYANIPSGWYIETTAVEPDGKILVGGTFSSTSVNVARLNPDGSQDTSFEANVNGRVRDILLQEDGKLIIAGPFTSADGVSRDGLARLNNDGSLDTSFAPVVSGVSVLALQKDGKLLIGGTFSIVNGTSRQKLARLNEDGTLDTSFDPSPDGTAIWTIVLNQGKIYVIGNFSTISGSSRYGVARLNLDGTCDTSFSFQYGARQSTDILQFLSNGDINYLQLGTYDEYDASQNTTHSINATYCYNLNQNGSYIGSIDPQSGYPDPTKYERIHVNGITYSGWNSYLLFGKVYPYQDKYNSYDSTHYSVMQTGISWVGDNTVPNSEYIGITIEDSSLLLQRPFSGGIVPYKGTNLIRNLGGSYKSILQVETNGRIRWLRYSTGPRSEYCKFDVSYDGGLTWTFMDEGELYNSTTNEWSLSEYVLSDSAYVRARAPSMGGYRGMSRGIIEAVAKVGADILLVGNGNSIPDGSTAPTLENNTLFNPQMFSLPSGYESKTFTINNRGAKSLSVSSLAVSGSHASDFVVSGLTLPITLTPSTSATFTLTFNPSGHGTRSATITIANSDYDKTAYDFVVQGEGVEPDINIKGNGINIVDGDITPSTSDDTDYGAAVFVNERVKTFTVENLGTSPLSISSITVSGANAADFSVSQIYSPIPPAGSQTFEVTLHPSPQGPRSATITINSNDPDEAAYDFAILGQGVEAWQPPSQTITYSNGTYIPIIGYSQLDLASKTLNLQLSYAPSEGTNLTVIRNEGLNPIQGTYPGMAQGEQVELTYNGKSYLFIANYYGGLGNDLVLHWAGTRPYAWGENASGRLGDSTTTDRRILFPVYNSGVLAGKTVLSMSAGQAHSLALLSDGKVVAWGSNAEGQLGINQTGGTSSVPVFVDTSSGSALENKKVIAVAAGYNFSLALCDDGKVVAWGNNATGQVGDGTTSTADIKRPVLVSKTGSVLENKKVVRIASGPNAYHSLAVCSDGTMVAWGRNTAKCLGDNTTTNRRAPIIIPASSGTPLYEKKIINMSAGLNFSMVVCSDGTVYGWGDNSLYRLGINSTVDQGIPISPSFGTTLPAGKKIIRISAGESHVLALRDDGQLLCWGDNSYGKLGLDSTTDQRVPEFVKTNPLLSTTSSLPTTAVVAAIGAGQHHSYALVQGGALHAWGQNSVGQLAMDSSIATQKVPALTDDWPLQSDQHVSDVTSGVDHGFALVGSSQGILAIESPDNMLLSNGETMNFGQVFFSAGVTTVDNTLNRRTIRVENHGNGPITGLSFSKQNDTNSSYLVNSYLSTTLNPGEYGTLVVDFKPTTNGTQTATLKVSATVMGVQQNFNMYLTGTGSNSTVAATYVIGNETPITASSFVATGKAITFNLSAITEAPGTINILEITDNSAYIEGYFFDIADGSLINFNIGGQQYNYIINYHGGTGNDLVLQRLDFSGLGDSDTDGLTNMHEFLYLTNANDHTSFTRPVNWTSNVNTTSSGNGYLGKSGGTLGNWDADAVSNISFKGNGTVHFIAEPGSNLALGLSTSNTDRHYTGMTHAIKLTTAGTAAIYESGIEKKSLGGYDTNTTFAIRRTGQQIEYIVNRTVIYTSLVPSSGTVLIDSSIASSGSNPANINEAYIQTDDLDDDGMPDSWEFTTIGSTARWAELLSFTPEGDLDVDGLHNLKEYYLLSNANDAWSFLEPVDWISHRSTEDQAGDQGGLIKITSTDTWDADAASRQSVLKNNSVAFRLSENAAISVGLSFSNTTESYNTIDYAIVTTASNTAAVYESGILKCDLGSYDSSTWFSIQRNPVGSISYLKNRIALYVTASPPAASSSLLIDTSFRTQSGEILEAFVQTDDQDGDGMVDSWEKLYITEGAGLAALQAFLPEADPDSDDLSNLGEFLADTLPLNADTDSDTLPDGWEVAYSFDPKNADEDSNGISDGMDDWDYPYPDGLTNLEEYTTETNPTIPDTDGDGLLDGWEVFYSLNPLNPDEDADGVIDGEDNFDTDQLLNFQEYLAGTSPWLADTDGDMISDDEEFYADFPSGGSDADGDGISDSDEVAAGSDPNDWTSTPLIQFQLTTPLR